jgi:diacylglycerol kinase (ATP)
VVVAVGGDGTLNEVIGGLVQPGVAQSAILGIAPAGSGDSVALDLGIDDTREAGRRLLAGHTRTIDLARVEIECAGNDGEQHTTIYAANVLTWGAGARINRRAEGMRWAGSQRYNVSTVIELIRMGRGSQPARIDGEVCEEDLLGVASLTRYSGCGLLLAPRADLSDGRIDLVQIKRTSRLELSRTFAALFKGEHLSRAGVTWRQTEAFDLELEPGAELVVDGELLPCDRARVVVERDRLEILA